MAKFISLTNLSAFWTKAKTVIDTAKAAAVAEAKTYADNKVASLASVFTYKGTKATLAEVQALTGMKTGDVWHVTANSAEYVYTGTSWEELGSTINANTGTTNGTIIINGKSVAVKGLGSAAYTASTAYATAAQGAKADTALQPADMVEVTEAEINALFA